MMRLVAPDLGKEPVALEAKSGLGQLKILVSADFDGCSQRQKTLEQDKSAQQEPQKDRRAEAHSTGSL
jgi:hypothetical protein